MSLEALFAQYRQSGDAEALGAVFDRLAPQLTLVAGHLAGSGSPEDIVQATFLDAIRHRDRWDASRPLTPWLIGLLGNHVRQARRLRHRVPDRSRLRVRESVAPADEAAANEAIAEVHAAVERLPRHYRQVMSLRLVHGLQLQQIATSLDVPLGTVKVRLHRGLELLRRTLPTGLASTVALLTVSERGLAAVRDTVVASAGSLSGTAVVAATAAGALLGGWIMKNVAIGVAVCVLLTAGWFAVDAWQPGTSLAPAGAGERPGPGVAQVDQDPVAAPMDLAPTVRRDSPPPRLDRGRAAVGTLTVQAFWQSDRSPAKGLPIKVRSAKSQEPVARGRSADDGCVTFADLDAGHYQVSSSPLNGTYDVEVVAGASALCEFAARDEHRLRVLVVDASSTPRSDADVWGTDFIGSETPRLLGKTGGAGILNYRGSRLDSVWARQRGRQPSARHMLPPGDFMAEAMVEEAVTVVLGEVGCTLLGSVVDPDGRALPKARVVIAVVDSWSNNSDPNELVLVTGPDGRFACDELPAGERFIAAHHSGYAPAVQRVTTGSEPAVVTLALRVGAALTGRVTDAEDAPIVGVGVQAFSSTGLVGIRGPWGNRPRTQTDTDGRYTLSGVPAGSIRAVVSLSPHIAANFTLTDGETRVWDARQAPEVALRGSVVGPDDEPLVGWGIEVVGGTGFLNHAMHMGNTDDDGRFEVGGLRDRDYRVQVFAPIEARKGVGMFDRGIPRAVLAAVRPSPEPIVVKIGHTAMANGAIEGSVVLPGAEVGAVTISLNHTTTASSVRRQLEPGTTTFRFGSLPAGDYQVTCEIADRGRIQSPVVMLRAGQTLLLQPLEPGRQRPAEIVLSHSDGRPCEGATVLLLPGMITCREISPGHYQSRPVSPGTMEATVYGPTFAPASFSFSTAAITERTMVSTATVELELQPALRRKQWQTIAIVTVKDSSGSDVIHGILKIAGEETYVWRLGLSPDTYQVQVRCSDGAGMAKFTVNSSALHVKLPLK